MKEALTPSDVPGQLDASGTSPAASGPAGAHFEGQVAAFYLLAMLYGAPPRGLPGTTIDRVLLQQANAGRALDDVTIYATDNAGRPAVLEIQVKRTITFSPGDAVFRKVVGQIAVVMRRSDFWSTNYQLAIATARSSRKIDGPYQDVLAIARQIGDSATLAAQLKLPGVANEDMRVFVTTLQSHLKDEGAAHDEETVWRLLRRLQILTFDFAAPGSASEDLARERALRTLHADESSRADAFWRTLVELAFDIAKSAGDRTRTTLLESLVPLGFRLSGERRHAESRAALAENARQALDDIVNHVGKAVLSRHERIAEVHAAFDAGRYVEIRGDAGVGKSGVLRQLAESLQMEGHVLVLSPGRCVPRGWTAMRAQIAFSGLLPELLAELANDGGAVVFLDNLDSYSIEERATVVDILRAASHVAGVSVLATARTDFGVEEPSWLPDDALDRLGRAPLISIDGLSDAEIEQLIAIDRTLTPLLSDSHPARAVTRNLFRLARLASRPANAHMPRTEAEMADEWWNTADGNRDAEWRNRRRLLNDLAAQALAGRDALEVGAHPPTAIDALVASGSLRNLVGERVSFRHDVFREWAIGCALNDDARLVESLDLKRPAPAVLFRGVELAARMAIESAADGKSWHVFLVSVSGEGFHRSWRRAALLALGRSEAAKVLLPRAQSILLADKALLLRELIRTVMAIDVAPAAQVFATVGIETSFIPAGLIVLKGPVAFPLVQWLLSVGDDVAGEATPDVVALYTTFSISTFGLTSITPLTNLQLYRWLRQIEPRNVFPDQTEAPRFWDGLGRDQIESLRTDLRDGFILFARATPDLAAEYLKAVIDSEHSDHLVQSILKMRGTLAQAAPVELAQLTELALINIPELDDGRYYRERADAFTYVDHSFIPASPAQGPFLELLTNSPEIGLALIHRLVAHAISYQTNGRPIGDDVIHLAYEEGARVFPWTRSYYWSRQSNYAAVTSALMALEAWAHRRIETGEPFEVVLNDVLGPQGSCAAYLLVAVDLIISHWPKSSAHIAEFLGCPELLCIDHTRQVHDQTEILDPFGFRGLQKEPRGTTSTAELKGRVSRRATLVDLLGNYTLYVSPAQLTQLKALLNQAVERLGPAGDQSDLGHPEFMVLHALNRTDACNWHEFEAVQNDGSTVRGRRYVSPPQESAHLQRLSAAAAPESSDSMMQHAITSAIEGPSFCDPEHLKAAVSWAEQASEELASLSIDNTEDISVSMQREAVLAAAMMIMRDGDADLRSLHGNWAKAQLQRAIESHADPVFQIRTGLRFNLNAIAYVGLINVLAHENTVNNMRTLLEVAAGGNHAAAHGFGAALNALHATDERLSRAVLRCAMRACIVPVSKWDAPDEEKIILIEGQTKAAMAAVDAEMAWLQGGGSEPAWPLFPEKPVRLRLRLRIPPAVPGRVETLSEPGDLPLEQAVHHQTAALWLRQVESLGDASTCSWLRDVATTYMPWTMEANGGSLANGEEASGAPLEWNSAFFDVVARSIVGLPLNYVAEFVTTPINSLPDQNFFDVIASFLRSFDQVYFDGALIEDAVAVAIREAFADRMVKSWGWKRLSGSAHGGIEIHIAPAIARLFFNNHQFGGNTNSYLFEKGIERIRPILPLLGLLVQSGSSPFVAVVTLNLLEVAPRGEHLDLLIQAGKSWIEAYPDSRTFWIDHGIGKRWCEIVKRICTSNFEDLRKDTAIYEDLDRVVSELVGLGISEAHRLEELLQDSGST